MLADVKEWLREEPRQALALGISAVALILSFLEVVPGPVDPAWLAVLLCGVPIIKEGAEGLFTRFDIRRAGLHGPAGVRHHRRDLRRR